MQLSPAGRHPGTEAHFPPMQTSEQQSDAVLQLSPARAHQPSGLHVRSHATEQHAPAYPHADPAPRHPVVGRHVVRDVGSSLHKPEQQLPELEHGESVAMQPPSGPPSVDASLVIPASTGLLDASLVGKRSSRRSEHAVRDGNGNRKRTSRFKAPLPRPRAS